MCGDVRFSGTPVMDTTPRPCFSETRETTSTVKYGVA